MATVTGAATLLLALAGSTITYVELPAAQCPTARCDALGYPVPMPVDSTQPVAGFRAYDALTAGLMALAMDSPAVLASSLGRSLDGRDIWAYVVSSPEPHIADGSQIKPAALITGTVHAREWQSPEVVAALVERLARHDTDGGLHQYLAENLRTVVVPVLNVDGFLQTQRFPQRALISEFPADPQGWPRDGRMRRKNLRDADETLTPAATGMLGVDINRNNPPFWASSPRSSGDQRSLVYHGDAPVSEPETRALQAAAGLSPAARLRLYIDVHSFTRAYLAAHTGQSRRDRLQDRLAERMVAVTGGRYCYHDDDGACRGNPTPPGFGIGASDEHFAYTYGIPAYTLEVEPGVGGAATDYGYALGVSHDGFILPEQELPRVREELTDATLLGLYRQAGPPAVAAAEIRESDSGRRVFAAHWIADGNGGRRLQVTERQALHNDTGYLAQVSFDKPMRVRNASGAIVQYPGQAVPLVPALALAGESAAGAGFAIALGGGTDGWCGEIQDCLRYADDTYRAVFTTPAGGPDLQQVRRLTLSVDAVDWSGQRLDANPATVVDWRDAAWSGYEDGFGGDGDDGGPDRHLRIVDDGSPAFVPPPAQRSGGGAPALWLGLLPVMACLRRQRPMPGAH